MAEFSFPQYVKGKSKKISKHAKNMIRAIINANPRKRPSIKKILKAKWMQGASESSSEDEFMEDEVLASNEFRLQLVKGGLLHEEFIPNKLIVATSPYIHKHPFPKGAVLNTDLLAIRKSSLKKSTPSAKGSIT